MSETATPSRKSPWWREVVIGFGMAFIVAAYYGARLKEAEHKAEQAEARLQQIEQQQRASTQNDVPTDLVCPDGTTLQRVASLEEKQGKAQEGDWDCIGKPTRRTNH